jgi:hypothetical protein
MLLDHQVFLFLSNKLNIPQTSLKSIYFKSGKTLNEKELFVKIAVIYNQQEEIA